CNQVLAEEGTDVVVMVQTAAVDALAKALVEQFKDTDAARRISIRHPQSTEEYLGQLAAADVVVAARFHAIILGLVVGTPGLGVYFDQHGHKMPGLFRMLGMEDRCFNLSSFD